MHLVQSFVYHGIVLMSSICIDGRISDVSFALVISRSLSFCSGERHGRSYRISVDRREKDELPHTLRRRSTDPYRREKDEVVILRVRPRSRERQRELVIREREGGRRHAIDRRDERDIREEADYYTRRNADCAHIGEAYNGATKDWTIIDVPPGTKRVTLDGIGGAIQEISWQRYNGARRSNFVTDGEDFTSDHETDREVGRVGRRYVKVKDRRDRLWTEITKDLVVREAIERAGYEYEETEYFYYIFAYLRYVCPVPFSRLCYCFRALCKQCPLLDSNLTSKRTGGYRCSS